MKKKKEHWFFEELYPDISYGFKVTQVIIPEMDTGFQKLMILESDRLGRVLILDRIVQLTEEDEKIYHEWIAHWPLFSLARPAQHVLIIGGGDGGVAREVLRHKSIQSVTMVEIDRMVIDLCRKHLPSVSEGVYDDPRFKLIIGDGAEVIRSVKGKYDVIIIDSTDPIGPAKSLFNTSFYESVYEALVEGGIAIHQTGALILQPFECPGSWRQMEVTFDAVQVVQFSNVSYMGGPFSLTAGSKGKKVFQRAARNAENAYKKSGLKTSWYSPKIPARLYPEFQKRLEKDKYGEEVVLDIPLLRNKKPSLRQVERWSRETCRAIKMKAFGTPFVSDHRLDEGDTLVQYIETSAINYRRFGNIACANCFTCAHLPVNEAIKFSLGFFKSPSAVCWHLPRGSFTNVREIRKNTRIFEAGSSSPIYKPRIVESAEVFSPHFKLPMERGLSSAFELIVDMYDCEYSMISSCEAVARWAGDEFCRVAGMKPIGQAEAPDFGHAKKKTAGPSVTQLFKGGANISHYSVNWLMIVVNIVSRKNFPLKKVLENAMKYFQSQHAVCWILPRGMFRYDIKEAAENTWLFTLGNP
ncbi:MAG: polyamine aminopropyltransferase [Candidatus Aminicenantales bacterium]